MSKFAANLTAAGLALMTISACNRAAPSAQQTANVISEIGAERAPQDHVTTESIDPRMQRASLRFNACIYNTTVPFTRGEPNVYGGVSLDLGSTLNRREEAYITLSHLNPGFDAHDRIRFVQVYIGNQDSLAFTSEDGVTVPYLRKIQTLTYMRDRFGLYLVQSGIDHTNESVSTIRDGDSTKFDYSAPHDGAQPLTDMYGRVGYAPFGSRRAEKITTCVQYAFDTSAQFERTELNLLDKHFPAESETMVAERKRIYGRLGLDNS